MHKIILLMSIIGYWLLPGELTAGVCDNQHCMAVVDAGSTGSRIHLYSYKLDKTNSPIAITELWVNKIKPGLASLEPTEQAVNDYLNTLMTGAPTDNFPVYFYATAGMRLIAQPKQQRFYQAVQQWFASQPYWHLVHAKTISGAEEGLFGWLAVNYQLNRLTGNKITAGVMDIGGASVQIAFAVTNHHKLSPTDLQEFSLYGRHWKVFVHSFLGLGQNEVTHQFLDTPACFIKQYPLPTGLPAAGNVQVCENKIASLLNEIHRVNKIIKPHLKANSVMTWYTLGGIVDLVKNKPFVFNNKLFTSNRLMDQAEKKVCQHDWSELNGLFPANDYLYDYCLLPAYYYALLVDGYGIDSNKPLYYLGDDHPNDWTMGVVLYSKVSRAKA